MGIDLKCSRCHKFIKSITKNDFGEVDGSEICSECAKQITEMESTINAFRKNYTNKVEKISRELETTREELLRKMVEHED